MPKNNKCQFKPKWVANYSCPEPPLEKSNYCIFHKPDKTDNETKLFKDKINKKLENKDYDFIGYHFPKETNLQNQVFEEMAVFTEATFEGAVTFAKATFQQDAIFWAATFQAYTDFAGSTFEKFAHFAGATFEGYTDFGGYFKEAQFVGATFNGYAIFWESTFEKMAVFRLPEFGDITFRDNISAREFFRTVKTCYQKQGEYRLAGEYYYKERIAERKQLPWYSHKRWLEYILLDGLCGYGERPLRAIRTGLGVLLGLALLYWKIGHIYPSPELFNEPDHALTFWDSLYFSVVTFTTLGFGDWRPDPSHWIRYVVMLEAFFGAFLMALFIVTFARRMMR